MPAPDDSHTDEPAAAPAGSAGGPAPADPLIGAVLQGRYRIDGRIGEGGMGTVYRGERVQLGRPVAIKFLQAAMAQDRTFVKRFELEARAMGRLSHPNCVSVIDFGVERLPYLVMDYVEGTALRDLIDAEGRLPADRALRIARQILAALTHAHARSIVHRDIKPDNVLIERSAGLGEHVRVLDFGLAKLTTSETALTVGMALGTPSYMAPEQAREGPIDERVDLYATGVVLFEMLTGRKPFEGDDVAEVLLKHQVEPPPRLREAAPGLRVSSELEEIVRRALAKSPADRFPFASAMAEAIEALPELAGPGAAAPRPAAPPSAGVVEKTLLDPIPSPLRDGPAPLAAAPPAERRAGAAAPGRRRPEARASAPAPAPARRPAPALRAALQTMLGTNVGRALLVGAGALSVVAAFVPFARKPPATPHGPPPPPLAAPARPVAPPEAPAASPAAAPAASPPAAAPPASDGVAAALALAEAGKRDEAIARLEGLRRAQPKNADAAAELARLKFEKRRWSEGIAAFRAAVKEDPARRQDPVLVGHVIRALGSDKAGDRADELLRELGPPARPFLREAAKRDPSPKVRDRCREILADGGKKKKPFLRWFR